MSANEELLRLIDSIHRDKGIDKEYLFRSLEGAIRQASQKRLGTSGELVVTINRMNGEIEAYEDGRRIDPATFGRIAAQTAKQVMIQKIREAERGSIFDEFAARKSTVVTGTVPTTNRIVLRSACAKSGSWKSRAMFAAPTQWVPATLSGL